MIAGLDFNNTLIGNTLIGAVGDPESGHPKNVTPDSVGSLINWALVEKIEAEHGGFIVISNQDGPGAISGRQHVRDVFWRTFLAVNHRYPGLLKGLFWSLAHPNPEEDLKGWECQYLLATDSFPRYEWGSRRGGNFRKPSSEMATLARTLGLDFDIYVGDQSGDPDWIGGSDSDRQFAIAVEKPYLDVREYLGGSC